MPSGHHDDDDDIGEIRRAFPHGLLADALTERGYTDVHIDYEGNGGYRVSMRSNEPVAPTVVEQQLAEIVARLDSAQWCVELGVAVVNGQHITAKTKVRDIHIGH